MLADAAGRRRLWHERHQGRRRQPILESDGGAERGGATEMKRRVDGRRGGERVLRERRNGRRRQPIATLDGGVERGGATAMGGCVGRRRGEYAGN